MVHKPGYKLDVLIAKKIFGCQVKKTKHTFGWGDHYECTCKDKPHALYDEYECHGIKRYSSNMTYAWEVVEKLKLQEPYIRYHAKQAYWSCFFWGRAFRGQSTAGIIAPHAICLAALEWVGAQ